MSSHNFINTLVSRSCGYSGNKIKTMEDKDVKIKMSVCPECGNAIRVAVEHEMTVKSKNSFAKEVMKHDLQVKTISLEEYRNSKVEMYCKENCSRK